MIKKVILLSLQFIHILIFLNYQNRNLLNIMIKYFQHIVYFLNTLNYYFKYYCQLY